MPKARLVFDGDGVYTEKEARIHKLTQETETKIDNIPGVVDDVHSTSTTDALSANMGKYLQDQIDNMSGTTIFLSTWDCTTGLPETDPSVDPYTYKTGNYYIVSNVADSGGTNYKPHGSTYTHGTPSTAVETGTVEMNDWYIYDGSQWILQPSGGKVIVIDDMLKPDSKNAVENRAVYSALTQKQNNILDLQTIREGATLGSTSIQPLDNITELTNNAGYQTAGDVATAIDEAMGTIVDDVNTKTFYLSSMNDLVHAQEAYDWYQSGKTPIISLTEQGNAQKSRTYILKTYLDNDTNANYLCFVSLYVDQINQSIIHGWSELSFQRLTIVASKQGVVSAINTYSAGTVNSSFGTFLSPGVDYGNAIYTPEYPGSPATKRYVDDTVSSAAEGVEYVGPTAPSDPTEGQLWYDTTENKLKVYDGTNWVVTGKEYNAGNGISISNDVISNTGVISTNNTFDNIVYLSQAEYDALQNKDNDTLYATPDSSDVSIINNSQYSSGWDGDIYHAPSNNAVYDKISTMDTTISNMSTAISNIDGLPSGGTTGQVVTKTASGAEWADTQSTEYTAGNGIVIGDIDDYSAMRGPCPEGFHIPTHSEFQSLKSYMSTLGLATGESCVTYLKMPMTGYRDADISGTIQNQGDKGYYYTCESKNDGAWECVIVDASYNRTMDVNQYYWKSAGKAIRPFKNAPFIPDSSRTTLYDGSSIATGAGIFYNSTLGLISISGNGSTWITIADKNLGATTVYNRGDTLNQNNCGKYYQWGNNYGFPWTGNVTISTTKVDASTYGPGNYYSSSTFITSSSSPFIWDSSDNLNLWGGETGVVHKDNAISVDEDTIGGIVAQGIGTPFGNLELLGTVGPSSSQTFDLSKYKWVFMIGHDGGGGWRYPHFFPTSLMTSGGSFGAPQSNYWNYWSIGGNSLSAITFSTPTREYVTIYGVA